MRLLRWGGRLALVLCAGILSLPAATRAEEPAAAVREQRRKQIEAMPEAERDRLKRNFKTFQELSPQQKEELRQLHAAVQQDADLRKTMDEYKTWLITLTPGQRDDLRKEPDPSRREQLVRKFRLEQEQAASAFRPGSFGGREGTLVMKGLSEPDLKAVMAVWEKAILQKLDVDQLSKLTNLQGLPRYAFIFETTMRSESERRRFFDQPAPVMVEDMIAGISNEEQRNLLVSREAPEQQRSLAFLIVRGIAAGVEKRKPDPATLEQFFFTLDGKKRDEIMRSPPEEFDRRLFRMYQSMHPETFPAHPTELFGWIFGGRFGGFRGGPGSPPGEPRRGPQGSSKGSPNGAPPFERTNPEAPPRPPN